MLIQRQSFCFIKHIMVGFDTSHRIKKESRHSFFCKKIMIAVGSFAAGINLYELFILIIHRIHHRKFYGKFGSIHNSDPFFAGTRKVCIDEKTNIL